MSSARTKVEQRDPFTGTQTSRPPQRKVAAKGKKREYEAVASTSAMSTSGYQPVVKRPKSFGVSLQRLMDSFFQAMREIIENKARPIIDKPSKLDALKNTLLSVKKLPLGAITTAEKICQCAKDELKNHLEHHGTKQNFQYFQEYVKDYFDAIVVSLQPQATTPTSTGESASIPATPVITPSDSVAFLHRDLSGMDMASDMSSVSGAPSHAAMSSISHNPSDIYPWLKLPPDNVEYRTCTVSFKSLLRKDVPYDLVESFLQKLNTALHDVSDYVIDLQLVVYTLMLSMMSSQLVAHSGNIQLKKARGFQIQGILPAGYNMKTDVITSAPPLPSNDLKFTAFCNGVKDLFQSRHIDCLHTALFGQRGTKISHPTFAALSSANEPILDAIARDTPQPANELMMVARGLYRTNLENMWASNKAFNRSLNKLLEILLRVHLAPKRESHYWELQQTKAKKQPKQVVKSIRNSFRSAIRSEKYKLQRYQRKAQGKPEDNN
ncbi:uncharacterized protein ATC70_012404 [Mucor velutinosus]|uniref:Uncharacterized protein n=1 Tax=Mucor velutinosus TaxID=708070 RepID=A0AAN7HR49_9FUNG|nr:hypothetical protein ATC70_012404 [Mucor velutinosus]